MKTCSFGTLKARCECRKSMTSGEYLRTKVAIMKAPFSSESLRKTALQNLEKIRHKSSCQPTASYTR